MATSAALNEGTRNARRIYIVGTGNVGTLVAHSLASLPEPMRPPLTLLLHRRGLLDAWRSRGETIDLLRQEDGASQPRSGIDVELSEPQTSAQSRFDTAEGSQEPIQNLIVSVLASQTKSALAPIRHRLGPSSSILFLQNGMGSTDEAATEFFPDPDTRPQFMQGIVAAGTWTVEPFVVRHAAPGKLPIGIIPRSVSHGGAEEEEEASSRYLLGVLSASPVLDVQEVAYPALLQRQLEKLIINAVANPLTALLNESNAVLQQPSLQPVITALIAESASIIRALPEIQQLPDAQERFETQRLEEHMSKYFKIVAPNTSSMCQHLRMGKKTEIEYISGYFIKRAQELGIACELNTMLRHMILTKEAIGLEKKH